MERRSFIKNVGISTMSLSALSADAIGREYSTEYPRFPRSRYDAPVFKSTQQIRSGIALGGIGTGSIEMRADGNFYNWSIFNNYPKGSGKALVIPEFPHAERYNWNC